uniref:Uncharacterized protein n=1 Tax=Timema poppense TaxID=170557 RepID=A0A7R9DRD1_TIMPO|nr:unnamed protein product [Timema poppensis]
MKDGVWRLVALFTIYGLLPPSLASNNQALMEVTLIAWSQSSVGRAVRQTVAAEWPHCRGRVNQPGGIPLVSFHHEEGRPFLWRNSAQQEMGLDRCALHVQVGIAFFAF